MNTFLVSLFTYFILLWASVEIFTTSQYSLPHVFVLPLVCPCYTWVSSWCSYHFEVVHLFWFWLVEFALPRAFKDLRPLGLLTTNPHPIFVVSSSSITSSSLHSNPFAGGSVYRELPLDPNQQQVNSVLDSLPNGFELGLCPSQKLKSSHKN